MDALRIWGIACCLAGAALAGGFAVLTSVCGMSSTSATDPGEEPGPTTCVSALHPFAVPFAVAATVAAFLVGSERPAWALAIGAATFVLGVVAGFSMGLYGIGTGALIATGAALGLGSRRRIQVALG